MKTPLPPINAFSKRKQTDEHIKKRINARRRNGTYVGRSGEECNFSGKPAWNKGKKGLQTHSKESRNLMRLAKLGKKQTEEHKKNAVIARMKLAEEKGYYKSKSRSEKISKALTGRIMSDDWRSKLSKSWKYENHVNEEIKKKQRKARSHQVFKKKDTKPERMMQISLALNGIKFEKQKLFENDQFYHRVDLFIEPNICIEVDGDYWHKKPEVMRRDQMVDYQLPRMGCILIRVSDKYIKKGVQGSAMSIIKLIKERQRLTLD